jgi:hypothetical protein
LLLNNLIDSDYTFYTFEHFITEKPSEKKIIILRHDVDQWPRNALKMAAIESNLGILSTYYFRIVKKSFNPKVIKNIVSLGHEIGYHYEDLAIAKGNHNSAIQYFKKNLRILRELYPVKTICMHGSPLSKWDNKLMWKKFNYKDFNLLGEPYFDLNFDDILYLSDTGRKWNNINANVRDKVYSSFNLSYNSTSDIIKAIQQKKFPQKVMINAHPQRWTNNPFYWIRELIFQNVKNSIKKVLLNRKRNEL